MSVNSAISARVKLFRRERGYTAEALVARFPPESGISLGYFRQLEGGKQRRWNVESLEVVATALDVPMAALFPDYRTARSSLEERLLDALRQRDWRAVMIVLGECAAHEELDDGVSSGEAADTVARRLLDALKKDAAKGGQSEPTTQTEKEAE